VTIAFHGSGAPRIKPATASPLRIDPTIIFHWLANRWHRRASACELDRSSHHYLRDMGIESREMYDVSELSVKCLRVGPRGP
jgi:uncharacterized protein YjiS (DUF1127 family)